MDADVDIAPIAALLGDPTRATIVSALHDGRALPAGELARRARVTPSTASAHLGRLVDAGLLSLERSGRHRYFRLANDDVAHAIESLAAIAPRVAARTLREAAVGEALSEARTCYDHLAGRLGVVLTAALIRERAVAERDGVFVLGRRAADVLARIDVDLDDLPARRPAVLRCLDWSERRPHLSGGLGAAICTRALERGWVERLPGSRAVRLTADGRRAFASLPL
jgi:DNA-binding transcriptional ArsR family regulator